METQKEALKLLLLALSKLKPDNIEDKELQGKARDACRVAYAKLEEPPAAESHPFVAPPATEVQLKNLFRRFDDLAMLVLGATPGNAFHADIYREARERVVGHAKRARDSREVQALRDAADRLEIKS